jgi:hypothetical protein
MHHLLDERDKSYRSIDHPLFEPFHRGEDPPPLFVAVDCLLLGLIQEVSSDFIIVGGAGRRVVQKEKSSQAILAPNNNFKDIEDDVSCRVLLHAQSAVDGIYGM